MTQICGHSFGIFFNKIKCTEKIHMVDLFNETGLERGPFRTYFADQLQYLTSKNKQLWKTHVTNFSSFSFIETLVDTEISDSFSAFLIFSFSYQNYHIFQIKALVRCVLHRHENMLTQGAGWFVCSKCKTSLTPGIIMDWQKCF